MIKFQHHSGGKKKLNYYVESEHWHFDALRRNVNFTEDLERNSVYHMINIMTRDRIL